MPFRRRACRYPEETNAPYGIAKKALLVMLQAYRQQYGLNGIYLLPVNLYAGFEITIMDLTEKIRRLVGYEGELVWDASKPDGQPRRCLDVTRARELFGFRAQMPFDEGLRRTIDWWRQIGEV